MSGNQFGVPLVIRMATGAGRQLAAQHSHSLEGWYAHIPSIKVLAPATIEDARGMLWAALEDPDPVLIFEHIMLYNMTGTLPAEAGPVDIDKAGVRRKGRDITLITYGGSLWKTLEAATSLASDGIEAEVIDLRTLRPLDNATIMASVPKTAAPSSSTRAGARAIWLPRFARASSNRRSWISTPQSAECAAKRCRSPTPGISNRRQYPRRRKSSPRRKRRWEKLSGAPVVSRRVPHAFPRRRHGSGNADRVAGQAGRSGQARRHHRRGGNAKRRDRNRNL